MNIQTTAIKDLLILKPNVYGDERGFFMESYNQAQFNSILQTHNQPQTVFVQDNQSRSSQGVLRGLHYQVGDAAPGKLVRVTSGAVWDVAVDLRPTSVSYGQWHGVELSAHNQLQFWIPPGFAHG